MIYLITESEFTQVLDGQDGQVTVHITPINADEIHKECDSLMVTSAIGDADTAAVVKAELRINVFANRTKPIKFTKGSVYYVARLTGGRLPEGATTLPEGFTLSYSKVVIA